jgi:large subunit ribosomal protein L15
MKLHDLRPAEGSRTERTRVGRGIAAGKGKTAGRGTKGQKARAGGSIPPWFEGGQTPLHVRIPKLRGFKNRFKLEYEVVNVGAIGTAAERGAFEADASRGATSTKAAKGKSSAQITINQDILRDVGLVRTLNKPLKILGDGELSAALFVVADAFTASARAKIEAAGGTVNVLEVPTKPTPAIGVDGPATEAPPSSDAPAAKPKRSKPAAAAPSMEETDGAEATADVAEAPVAAEATVDVAEAPAAAEATADVAEAPVAAETPVDAAETQADAPETSIAVEGSAVDADDPDEAPTDIAADDAETTSRDDA